MPTRLRPLLLALSLLPAASPLATCTTARAADRFAFFEKRIRPLLVKRCLKCHGAKDAQGGLRLDSRAGWKAGGESGPAIVPGKPNQSLLVQAIRPDDDLLQMPPDDEGRPLTAREIADVVAWVRSGAPDPRDGRPAVGRDREAARRHWAFQPLRKVQTPAGRHPLDYLIDKQLQRRGFTALPVADAATRTRRAVFDLHGLLPDEAQRALGARDFEDLIDRLLASPRYGERWGRHWLDVARYADAKDGVLMYGDKRVRPFAYTYRDYVIRAFNADKPFDQFIREQLAADRLGLPAAAPELAALGFLTLGRMFDRNRHDVIDDQIDTVTRGLLGLTVACARCHDHKFDPIPTADYYALHGVFANCREPIERPRIEKPATPAAQQYEEKLAKQVAAVRKMQDEQYMRLQAAAREQVSKYLVQVATTKPDISETSIFFLSLLKEQLRPQIVHRWRLLIRRRARPGDPVFAPWRTIADALQTGSAPTARQWSDWQTEWRKAGVDPRVVQALTTARPSSRKQLAETYAALLTQAFANPRNRQDDALRRLMEGRSSPIWFPKSQVWFYMSRTDKDKFRGMRNNLDLLSVQSPQAAARAMVLKDAEEPYRAVVFRRGDPTQPGAAVPRQFLSALSKGPRKPFGPGSGRLELAQAITTESRALTARVWVNRVWMHHFGEPLVANPSDFGLRTATPLQWELLDYLAAELLRHEWRLKPLHRLIMTSAAYQRESRWPTNPRWSRQHREDPSNQLWWRAIRRRLDLESLRDGLLQVSGQLDLTMFGRPSPITSLKNRRRTVYAFVERQSIPNIVRSFDFASPDSSAARRIATTVPQQSLFLMNSAFVAQAAQRLADRLKPSGTADAKVTQLYRWVYGREPTEQERRSGVAFVERESWATYAQVLLMTNEFLFVD